MRRAVLRSPQTAPSRSTPPATARRTSPSTSTSTSASGSISSSTESVYALGRPATAGSFAGKAGEARPEDRDACGVPGGAAGAYAAELFERHSRKVLGLCRMFLRDRVEA